MPIALTIAGTDPTGGAGIMADLKSFQARSVYGMAVVTSVVAQNTCGVQQVANMDSALLEAQLTSVFSDMMPHALKTGMLATTKMMHLITRFLPSHIPYVLDPVMIATSGDRLIDTQAIAYLRDHLLPLAHIATPNVPEAEQLVGFPLTDEAAVLQAGAIFLNELGCRAVVIKGGHVGDDQRATDYLFTKEGRHTFSSPRFHTQHTHGTGCTFAAVITAELAKGKDLPTAVGIAKKFVAAAIEHNPQLGHGNGPVNHCVHIEE